MSSADKTKLDGIEDGSQVNLVESISVNGNAQTITGKNVDIAVPLVDATLANSGESADAKATGDAINAVSNTLTQTASTIRSEFRAADTEINNIITQTAQGIRDELATKQDTLPFATPTAEDVGKALMPKTIENGEVTEWEFGEAGKVDDVQVDGVSIIENKVANIPVATSTDNGVVKVNALYGVGIRSNGTLQVTPATSPAIKSGMNIKTPITPDFQHESTFYGLAKAAGHDEKDSELLTGTYTDEAKTAIQNMLGVPSSSELDNYVTFDNYASASKAGAVKSGTTSDGITIGNDGIIKIPIVNLTYYRNGNYSRVPVTIQMQHMSVFYGLAKAAGDTTQSSSANAVGAYTDEAKSAIQTMLGIDTAIADAISGITGFEFRIVTELPETGEKGIIYLVPKTSYGNNIIPSGSSVVGQATVGNSIVGVNDNIYYEYIYVNNRFEKIGDTKVDLSGYLNQADIATNESVNTMLAEVFP